MKTVYKIIKVSDRNGHRLSDPFLYAFTDDKKLLNKFKETRNMNLFCISEEDMSKKEVLLFTDKQGFGKKLVLREYKTKAPADAIEKSRKVKLVVSSEEDIDTCMHTDKILNEVARYTKEDPSCMIAPILHALRKLSYFDIYCWSMEEEQKMVPSFYDGIKSEAFDAIDSLTFDQLSVFLYFFGNTMKI